MSEEKETYDSGISYRISALAEGEWTPLHEDITDRKEAGRLLTEAKQTLRGGGFAPEVVSVKMTSEVMRPELVAVEWVNK